MVAGVSLVGLLVAACEGIAAGEGGSGMELVI